MNTGNDGKNVLLIQAKVAVWILCIQANVCCECRSKVVKTFCEFCEYGPLFVNIFSEYRLIMMVHMFCEYRQRW